MDREIEEKELYIKSLHVQGGFTTPETYFAKLDAQIIAKISENNAPKKAKVFNLAWLSAAAVFLVMLGIFLQKDKLVLPEPSANLDAEMVAEQLGNADLSAELLCDAGWCLELEQLPFMADSNLVIDNLESDLLFDEL